MREAKFEFVPEELIDLNEGVTDDCEFRMTISTQNSLHFTKEILTNHNMANKFIKFFGDKNKRTLGWTVLEDLGSPEIIKDMKIRHLAPDRHNGKSCPSITKILKYINVPVGILRKNLPVYIYKDQKNDRNIYYIELKQDPKVEFTRKLTATHVFPENKEGAQEAAAGGSRLGSSI